MRKKSILLQREASSSMIYLAIGIFLLSACAGPSSQRKSEELPVPVIQSIDVRPSLGETVVEIVGSRAIPYTAFKLADPPKIVMDLEGNPGEYLKRTTMVYEGNIEEIRLEEGGTGSASTRVVVDLVTDMDYLVSQQDNVITLSLTSKAVPSEPAQGSEPEIASEREAPSEPRISTEPQVSTGPQEAETDEEAGEGPPEPRIFFKPRAVDLNQVLGVDFAAFDYGKARLTVTTDREARYDLERKGPTRLQLTIENATIPPLLMRRLESTYFEGAVDRVKASVEGDRVFLVIFLREMVPFHVRQTDNTIEVDFSRSFVKPKEKTLAPLRVAEGNKVIPVKAPSRPGVSVVPKTVPEGIPGIPKKTYTGTRMTMDFINADVTNILRLIAEVSNLNIVWSPDVKGTVSMRLKNVPWDQALDLVLSNNNLAQRKVGNVLWITTKSQMAQIEAEEKRKQEEYEAELEAKRKKELEAKTLAKQLEPLKAAYIAVDFAIANEIKDHIKLSDRGSISIDARTNTIIVKDIASVIAEAKEIVKRFDSPVKQIMIEARVVDATESFARDLGVRWNVFNRQYQERVGMNWERDPEQFTQSGDLFTSGSFFTNAPTGWIGNIGLYFARLTNGGLGTITVDASLALAEAENKVEVISAPKVIASNGKEAVISRGERIIIGATENVEATTLDASLKLKVTPTVSYNNYVTMRVEVSDDQAVTLDLIREKKIDTELIVKSGDTIVMGGIYKEENTLTETGIPWLRKIPVLGWAFQAQSKTSQKTELLIFLTPTVLPYLAKAL